MFQFKPIYEPVYQDANQYIQHLINEWVDGRKLRNIDPTIPTNLIASVLAYKGADSPFVVSKKDLTPDQKKAWDALCVPLTGTLLERHGTNKWKVKSGQPDVMVVSCERKDHTKYGSPLHFRLEGEGVRWRHPQDIEPDLVRTIGLVHAARVELVAVHKALAVAHSSKTFPVKWHTAKDLPEVNDVHYVLTEEHVQGLGRYIQHWLPRAGYNLAIHYTSEPHNFGEEPKAKLTAFVPAPTSHQFRDIYANHTVRFFKETKFLFNPNGPKELLRSFPQIVPPMVYQHCVNRDVIRRDYGQNLSQLRMAHVG